MRQACVNFQRKIKTTLPIRHGRQQMTVYGELDAIKLREQQVIAERDALAAEIEKLKALLAEKKS